MNRKNSSINHMGFVNHTNEFWDLLATYNGDNIDVLNRDYISTVGDVYYRNMTPFERKLYTLSVIKCEERDQIIKKICGQHPRDVSSAAIRTLIVKTIQDRATDDEKSEIIRFWKIADEFKSAIFEFVGREISIKYPGASVMIKLRPQNTIYINDYVSSTGTIRESISIRGMGKMPNHFF